MEARAVPDIEVPNSAERDAIARRAAIGGDRADARRVREIVMERVAR